MPEEPKKELEEIQTELGELVKRALVQAADLQTVEEKLKELSDRSSKMTPPPSDGSTPDRAER